MLNILKKRIFLILFFRIFYRCFFQHPVRNILHLLFDFAFVRYTVHGRAELDVAGFIRAEENDKRTHIKKFVENFTFL